MSRGRLYEVAEQQRAALLARERQAVSELVHAYGGVWQRIRRQLDVLLAAKVAAETAGESVDAGWLWQFDRLGQLQRQVEAELRAYAAFADPLIVRQQGAAVDMALGHAEALVRTAAGQAGISVSWVRLPTAAFEDLIGFTAAGSPLRELFATFGEAAAAVVRDELIQGLALGYNPTRIARTVRAALGGNLARALTISRTEVLRAYREAIRRSYQANADVVAGWIWNCACTERSCAMCWAMHGTEHGLDERLDDHPNGRCSMLPKVKPVAGMADQVLPEPGPEQFKRLTPEQQDGILGRAAGAAYRAGAFQLQDVVKQTFDPAWGSMRRVRSLRELVGQEEARKWLRETVTARQRQALGADIFLQTRLQDERLREVQALKSNVVTKLMTNFKSATHLPKIARHFQVHGSNLGASDVAAYEALLLQHLHRDDLRVATYISTKSQRYRMWLLVDVDTGVIAQYNETKKQLWSFFRQRDWQEFLDKNAPLWWLEARRSQEEWRFSRWQT